MKRKPNNPRARAERAMRSLLRVHRACIVDASVPEVQVMLHYKTCCRITSKPVADALCDIAHHWTVYMSAICQDGGRQWAKSDVIGHAWIAIPDSVSLDEEQAHRIYQAVGAWRQPAAA